MRRLAFPLLLTVCLPAVAAEARGDLDASPSLFAVMAALNAAGYDAEVDSPNNHPLRDAIRAHLASKKLPSVPRLREYFAGHRLKNDTQTLSQYISYALAVDGPPLFEHKMRSVEIPPDVIALDGLSPLLTEFCREADIDGLFARAQPAIESYIERYHEPVRKAVLDVNAYLRNETSGYLGRRFQVFIELLAAPNQVQTRSYGNEYFVVLTPSQDVKVKEVRHSYLHYLIDPLTTKFGMDVNKKRGVGDHAQRAPALDPAYKEDFLLLVSESLIKAVEARIDRSPAGVQEALLDGYVLAPFFAEQLPVFEKQPQSMRLNFPEIVDAIDLKKEEARLAVVQFNAQPRVRHARAATIPTRAELTGVQKTLEDAETAYNGRDLVRAREKYQTVLRETSDSPLHARAYYGMARIAVLERDPETGEKLFTKALDSSPEPYVRGWVLVYLGRLADARGDREQAVKYYQEALKVEGASAAARKSAEKEVHQGLSK